VPGGQSFAVRLSSCGVGRALLFLATLLRSRKHVRWHVSGIMRNLLPRRRKKRKQKKPPSHLSGS